MIEINEIGKPTRFFSDDMKTEFTCLCPPRYPDLDRFRSRNLTVEVAECPIHGRAVHPENWPIKPFLDYPVWDNTIMYMIGTKVMYKGYVCKTVGGIGIPPIPIGV